MKHKLLSLCFLNFNDTKKLSSSIPDIFNIVQKLDTEKKNLIEILISDNNSDDYDELRHIFNKHQKLKFYKTKKNTGVDINIRNCIEKASGKFVWIFAADDYIRSVEHLSFILQILKDKEPDIFTFGINLYPGKLLNTSNFILLDDTKKMIRHLINAGKISTGIYIKNENILKCLSDADNFDGLGYYHLSYGACLHNHSYIKHYYWKENVVYTKHAPVNHVHEYHPKFSQNAHLSIATPFFLKHSLKLRFITSNHLLFQLLFVIKLPYKGRANHWEENKLIDYLIEIGKSSLHSMSIEIKILRLIAKLSLLYAGKHRFYQAFSKKNDE